MRTPSKNISTSIASQAPAGRRPVSVSVGRQKSPGIHPIPGEGGTSMPPGAVHPQSVKPYAGALGGMFGNGKK